VVGFRGGVRVLLRVGIHRRPCLVLVLVTVQAQSSRFKVGDINAKGREGGREEGEKEADLVLDMELSLESKTLCRHVDYGSRTLRIVSVIIRSLLCARVREADATRGR
jgi:hypothetical protein